MLNPDTDLPREVRTLMLALNGDFDGIGIPADIAVGPTWHEVYERACSRLMRGQPAVSLLLCLATRVGRVGGNVGLTMALVGLDSLAPELAADALRGLHHALDAALGD